MEHDEDLLQKGDAASNQNFQEEYILYESKRTSSLSLTNQKKTSIGKPIKYIPGMCSNYDDDLTTLPDEHESTAGEHLM